MIRRGKLSSMASLTCLACRHVVEVAEGASGKCENCGAEVRPPPPPFTSVSASQPRPAIAPPTESSHPPPATPAGAPPGLVGEAAPSQVRSASIVCLVCGLVFFVPFVTQAAGLVAGGIAIFRRRLNNERVAAAWVGIILCVLGLIGWTAGITSFLSFRGAGGFAGAGRFPGPMAMPYEENEWGKTADWKTELERVYDAASAYRRDFGRWPGSIDDLGGHSLPKSFELSKKLTYYPVPEDETRNFDRLLIVSELTLFDQEANELDHPHRLILRLGGTVEVLPAEEVDRLLAGQTAAPPNE